MAATADTRRVAADERHWVAGSTHKKCRHGESNTRRLWFYGPFGDCDCCGQAIQPACCFSSGHQSSSHSAASPPAIALDRPRCVRSAPGYSGRAFVAANGVSKRVSTRGIEHPTAGYFLRFELVSGYFLLPPEVVKTGFSGFFCVQFFTTLEGGKKLDFGFFTLLFLSAEVEKHWFSTSGDRKICLWCLCA